MAVRSMAERDSILWCRFGMLWYQLLCTIRISYKVLVVYVRARDVGLCVIVHNHRPGWSEQGNPSHKLANRLSGLCLHKPLACLW